MVERQSKADAWRERLLAVTQNPDMAVGEASAKVPPAMKKELGDALYAQLLGLEKATQADAASDDAVLGDLNGLITAE